MKGHKESPICKYKENDMKSLKCLAIISLLAFSLPVIAPGRMFTSDLAIASNMPLESHKRIASEKDINCIAENIYHEARGEGEDGMLAVANVTLNRYFHSAFPNTICDVVHQPHQFSWTKSKKKIIETESFKTAKRVAEFVLAYSEDITSGSLYFHNTSIKSPKWTKSLQIAGIIGNHIFYKEKSDGN